MVVLLPRGTTMLDRKFIRLQPGLVRQAILDKNEKADLDRFLAQSEVVVVTLPLTTGTQGLFDASKFALMPAGSWFVNIGRGPIIKENVRRFAAGAELVNVVDKKIGY